MTPQQIFASLARSKRLPRNAMAAAGRQREAMVPLFLEYLERMRQSDSASISEKDIDVCLLVIFLLGEWREVRAYRPLTALLRHDPDVVELLLGDAITEGAARIVAGTCDGDLRPIFDVIEDDSAEEFARAEMIEALLILTRHHPSLVPEVDAYLEAFPSLGVAQAEPLWGAWAFAVAERGLAHLEPAVREAFEGQRIPPMFATFAHFREDLNEALASGHSEPADERGRRTLIESAADELAEWDAFSGSRETGRAGQPPSIGLFGGPIVHDSPKVGRNDPCPCGSGRKYKKCCLN